MFAFQTNRLNRYGETRHREQFIQPLLQRDDSRFLPLFEQDIVSYRQHNRLTPCWLRPSQLHEIWPEIPPKHLIYLGEMGEQHYFALRLKSSRQLDTIAAKTTLPTPELINLRHLFKEVSAEQAQLCNLSVALEHWHNTHQYCGYCGHQTYSTQMGFVRTCSNPGCEQQHFPRTDSAVICAITHQDRLLLGRQKSWPEKRYSVIAGFVEPGETLEQAVAREAYEETGLKLTNIRYFHSQPWPFPQSLMVGFTAEATDPTIKLLDQELEEANWFSREEVNQAVGNKELILPFQYSISRALVNQWLSSK